MTARVTPRKSNVRRTSPPACRRKAFPPRPNPRNPSLVRFREPHLDTPAEVHEEKPFAPVPIAQRPQGILETIRVAASNVVKKVQRMIKPVKRTHKEVIINAESLETRVAVMEEGKPGRIHH